MLRLWSLFCRLTKVLQFSIQVTTYQKQYFYTDSLDSATEFVRTIADDIKRPFSVRSNNLLSLLDPFAAHQVQPIHPNSGGVEQLRQDLGHGQGVERGPGNRGERVEKSSGERRRTRSYCRFHFSHCRPRHLPVWVKVFLDSITFSLFVRVKKYLMKK